MYKKKLVALLEGLECQKVSELAEMPCEHLWRIGEEIAKYAKVGAGEDITCPFCRETDFDTIGLKHHLLSDHCNDFDATLTIEQERHLSSKSSRREYACSCSAVKRIGVGKYCPDCGGRNSRR